MRGSSPVATVAHNGPTQNKDCISHKFVSCAQFARFWAHGIWWSRNYLNSKQPFALFLWSSKMLQTLLCPRYMRMSQWEIPVLVLLVDWGAQQFEGNLNLQESRPQRMRALDGRVTLGHLHGDLFRFCLRYCMMATDQEPRTSHVIQQHAGTNKFHVSSSISLA